MCRPTHSNTARLTGQQGREERRRQRVAVRVGVGRGFWAGSGHLVASGQRAAGAELTQGEHWGGMKETSIILIELRTKKRELAKQAVEVRW